VKSNLDFISLIKFVILNLVGFLMFFFILVITVFLSWDTSIIPLVVLIGSITHLYLYWKSFFKFSRNLNYIVITVLTVFGTMFIKNRTDAWNDNSPFGSILSTIEHDTWGFIVYFRQFDTPIEGHGSWQIDYSALFLHLEFSVFVALIYGIIGVSYQILKER